jgi:nucleoside-diphosphate-sugar epimerase/aryl carrier-like protein
MRESVGGLYELVLVRDPKLKLYQGIFNTFPNIQEWSMNDLYSRHPDPSKSFLYMYRCRKDDVIVLSNGEKVAPALIEATLMSDPLVKGAMIVGRGMFQPAALIDLAQEPPKGAKERYKMVQRLLQVISEANQHAPAHGKLDHYHILFADPNKPICYLGQGKIQRYKTYQLYENDIKELYRAAENASEQVGLRDIPNLDFATKHSIEEWLKHLVAGIAGVDQLGVDQDFFETGIDSLQVIRMARELRFEAKRAGLGQSSEELFTPREFYSHPTLGQLATFILQHSKLKPTVNGIPNGQKKGHTNAYDHGPANGTNGANGHSYDDVGSQVRSSNNGQTQAFIRGNFNNYFEGYVKGYINGHIRAEIDGLIGHFASESFPLANNHTNGNTHTTQGKSLNGHVEALETRTMQSLLDTCADSLPYSNRISPLPSTENMVVILTGSTGSLGSYLLESLYNNDKVSHIFCLNRSSNAAEKHNEISTSRGLSHLSPERVEFLKTDLSKPHLGLKATVYEKMLKCATHIIRESLIHPSEHITDGILDNQWPVNFNWALSSFTPYIRGVRNLIQFSLESTHNSFILYVSSVAAVGGLKSQGEIPESPIYDFSAASKTGYGQSKLVSELLLDKAADRCGVRSACCRVGIVAGPVESKLGIWNRHEYIPSVSPPVQSSIIQVLICLST